MAAKGKAEYFLEDVSGCGSFQVMILLFAVLMAKICVAYSILFMSYGNYNPGWKCLDNITIQTTNITMLEETNTSEYTDGSCEDYMRCQNVEFNPETSTVVTEWGLVCDKAWMPSLTISVQMLGMLLGSYLGGQLSDTFGRKKIFYGAAFLSAILHFVSSFSVSWNMMVVIRFFIGVTATSIMVILYIFLAEFMTSKWRATLVTLPFWYVGSTLQALVAMALKDWRNLELVGCGLYLILFVPVFWVPESLRWLEVKGRTKEFMKVVHKIAKCNGTSVPLFDDMNSIQIAETTVDDKKYTIFDLFRPGYRMMTFIVGFLDFVFSLIYYALSFGVKSFYGDFYINLILLNIIAVPFLLSGMLALRYLRRKTTALVYLGSSVLCSFAAVGCLLSNSDGAKATGGSILVSVAKGTLDVAWLAVFARIAELYPTVVRSTALGFASLAARIGGILAPFIIPNDKNHLYVFMIAAAIAIMICYFLSCKLPETKGKQLKETFQKSENEIKKEIEMRNCSNHEQVC